LFTRRAPRPADAAGKGSGRRRASTHPTQGQSGAAPPTCARLNEGSETLCRCACSVIFTFLPGSHLDRAASQSNVVSTRNNSSAQRTESLRAIRFITNRGRSPRDRPMPRLSHQNHGPSSRTPPASTPAAVSLAYISVTKRPEARTCLRFVAHILCPLHLFSRPFVSLLSPSGSPSPSTHRSWGSR
jgi:hypothetical protein